MPTSASTFDNLIEQALREQQPKRVLDIGPGEGKYGKMVRRVLPSATIVGVEPFGGYVAKYNLKSIYNEIFEGTVQSFVQVHPDNLYDMVIMSDVLEHLTKSDGWDVIHKLSYMANWMLIKVPQHAYQGAEGGVEFERHQSRWVFTEFFDYDMREMARKDNMMYVKLFFMILGERK